MSDISAENFLDGTNALSVRLGEIETQIHQLQEEKMRLLAIAQKAAASMVTLIATYRPVEHTFLEGDIVQLHLHEEVVQALMKKSVKKVRDLIGKTEQELIQLGIPQIEVRAVILALSQHGLSLLQEKEPKKLNGSAHA